MAKLQTSNLLSDSLNLIDPYNFDEGEMSLNFMSSPMLTQKSPELVPQDLSGLDLSQSHTSTQLDTSGLLLRHIDTQKEVRV